VKIVTSYSCHAILHSIKICGHPTAAIWTQSSNYKIWGVLQERGLQDKH